MQIQALNVVAVWCCRVPQNDPAVYICVLTWQSDFQGKKKSTQEDWNSACKYANQRVAEYYDGNYAFKLA